MTVKAEIKQTLFQKVGTIVSCRQRHWVVLPCDIPHLIRLRPLSGNEETEESYRLSKDYRELFDEVYDFALRLVTTVDDSFSYAQRRGRYWSALAIIRCVMSSPAAAVATLSRQASKDAIADEGMEELNEDLAAAYVYDPTDTEQTVDVAPSVLVEQGKQTYSEADKRKLRSFVKRAETLQGKLDLKLQRALALVKTLLEEGYQPILWCRYITTRLTTTSRSLPL